MRRVYLRFDLGLDLRLTFILVDTPHPAHPVYVLLLYPRETNYKKNRKICDILYVHQMGSASIRSVDPISADLLHITFRKYTVYHVSGHPLSYTAVRFRSPQNP